jgi:hypothetical protein
MDGSLRGAFEIVLHLSEISDGIDAEANAKHRFVVMKRTECDTDPGIEVF